MIGELQRRKLVKVFSMYDTCNSGALTFSDFERVVQSLADLKGWKPESPEYTQLLSKFMHRWTHLKGNIQDNVAAHAIGNVQLKDWLQYFEDMLDSEARYQDEIHSLGGMIFDVCDVDDSGHLDRNEWFALFKAYNLPVVYADEAFAKLDKNQDGMLQRDEVVHALKDFYYSEDPQEPANFMFGPY